MWKSFQNSKHILIKLLFRYFIRKLAVFLAKILLKTEQACADTIIFAAIDFSCQNTSGIYLS